MKKIALTLALACALAIIATTGVYAAEEAAKKPAPVVVTVTGTNYCLLGEFAKEAEADANYKLNALLVTEALDADGKAIEGLAGKTLQYVPTKTAQALFVGDANKGATVTVKGKLFTAASALLVDSFEAAAAGDDWDDLEIGSLSGQQVL